MMAAYVFRDGARVTPWMKYQLDRLDADFFKRFGCHIIVSSGIRTEQEQRNIFFSRYVLAGAVRGRRVYDTRWFEGKLWYRVSSAGTVAQPRTSNHEVQGSKAAVDLRDTGKDAGVSVAGSARSNWLRANAAKYDLVPSGFGFGEAWHYDCLNIHKSPPAAPAGSTPTTSKGDTVKVHYHLEDATARNGGRSLAAGANFWLNIAKGAATSKATNVVGGVGPYAFALHVYAEGQPGDYVDVALQWDNTKTDGPHSPHYTERMVIPAGGVLLKTVGFLRAVASGYAVYAGMTAGSKNAKPVKVTVFDSDAYLFG